MTIFSKIIAGDIPSFKLAEDGRFYAFLDIFPSAQGHALVVPKIETDRLFDLPKDYLDGILTFAQPIANAIKKAYNYDRINIMTVGFEVPHTHIHLLPMNGLDDMNMILRKTKPGMDELKIVQQKILEYLEK